MHVGHDGMIWGGAETGVAAATRRLVCRLIEQDSENRHTIIVPRDFHLFEDGRLPNDKVQRINCDRHEGLSRVIWQQFSLPNLTIDQDVDVLYCPCYTVPVLSKVPTIVTVHDLIALNRPDVCRMVNVLHFRLLIGKSIRKARCVTVPTESVKDDVLRTFPNTPETKVHVIPWGVDAEIVPMDRDLAAEQLRNRFCIEGPFVLFVGRQEPKKNLQTLVAATAKKKLQLVVAGDIDRQSRASRRFAEVVNMQCQYVGYVTPAELGMLYSAATAFAFPSHIEGFGLPVLEAMACGTPVVTSDSPALKEICGGAAIHVAADDIDTLAQSLSNLVEDESLRRELSERGRNRARMFTWDRSAQLFRQALSKAAET